MNGAPFPVELRPWAEREITAFRLGPEYGRIRKLEPAEAAVATSERQRWTEECLERGARPFEANPSKIFSGDLSPGCRSCGEGTWSCLDFERRCTRRCFFCPRDPASRAVVPPSDGLTRVGVDSPEAYAALLVALGYRGASFSGGEPFLNYERMLAYTRAVRGALGDSGYVWAYTNGDLVDEEKVRALSEAGLDELRFDVSARNYDLSPIQRSAREVNAVAVEIPAIPEDYERVRALLPRFEALGVKYVNLHQLFFTSHNAPAFARRGYTVVHSAHHGYRGVVLESELTALRLLRDALESRSSLSVNYCSAVYKHRFQSRGSRRRLVAAIAAGGPLPPDVGSMTPLGLLRRLRVPRPHAAAVLGRARDVFPTATAVDGDGLVFVHPESLDAPALEGVPLDVEYYAVTTDRRADDGDARRWDVEIHPSSRLRVAATSPVATVTLSDSRSRSMFGRLVAEEAPPEGVADSDGFYAQFTDLEFLDRGLPDYQ